MEILDNNTEEVVFNELVYKASKYLKVPAMKFTHNSYDANDLIQDTILKALNNKDKFRQGSNIKAWLYIIMKNTFISGYHSVKKKSMVDTIDDSHLNVDNGTTPQINDGITNVNTEVINNAIDKLSRVYRIPFLMFYEGYRYEEIAEKLGKPLGTIKNRIHVARKILMVTLKDFK